jgi:hypothetical protein
MLSKVGIIKLPVTYCLLPVAFSRDAAKPLSRYALNRSGGIYTNVK